ncbi:hypothetical protein LR48_Vigan03g235200 [Vigna angularis]|uniref:Uncharacterized protein n=1 Tax=Phaseolus angularis TaxID=3914 RepID=A0A0L9U859_PHAAN|nr:hypothetical protein LR48_Vigan03g235200 [Vigna angularis]
MTRFEANRYNPSRSVIVERSEANRYNPGRSVVVDRSETNRYNPGRSVVAESVGSVRKEGSDNDGRNTRNLPYSEFLKRRKEGRCFRCGGLFGPGHHCPERSLRMTILAEDEEEETKELRQN